MRRGKLPAYGLDLVTLRNNGQHPERVWVIVGDDWTRRPVQGFSLFVPAAAKGCEYDWSIVAGLPVHVVSRGGDVFAVAAAAARCAAPVVVHWIVGEDDWPDIPGRRCQEDVTWVMFWAREQTKKGFQYMHGWSDELQHDYLARRAAYFEAIGVDLSSVLDEVAA